MKSLKKTLERYKKLLFIQEKELTQLQDENNVLAARLHQRLLHANRGCGNPEEVLQDARKELRKAKFNSFEGLAAQAREIQVSKRLHNLRA